MAIDPTVTPTTNAGAPVPTQTAPNPAAAAPPDVQDTSAPGGPDLQAAPVTPPAPKPNQNMDVNAHHAMIGKIFSTIAGGQTTDYANTPDGPVPVKRDLRPGEIARNILGSALSLMAAGAGGAQAGLQGKQYRQDPNQTIGGMEKARIQTREQQAQKVFENRQASDEQTLRAHKDAREQQKAMQDATESADNHRKANQEYEHGNINFQTQAREQFNKDVDNYNAGWGVPGTEHMKDTSGKVMQFYDIGKFGDPGYLSAGQQAMAYAIAHPEAVHGATSENSKFGVRPVFNPYTGATEIADFPATLNDQVLENVGQATGKDGELLWNPDGSPKANTDPRKGPVIFDPKTKNPTVATTPVRAADVPGMAAKQSEIDEHMSATERNRAETEKIRSEIANTPVLSNAVTKFNKGEPLNDKEMKAFQGFALQNLTIRQKQLAAAKKIDDDESTPETKAALDQATENEAEASDTYDKSWSLTPGIKIANQIIRQGTTADPGSPAIPAKDGKPAVPAVEPIPAGSRNWVDIDRQIERSALSDDEKQVARAKAWNAMSPAQQAAASGKAAPATNPAAAAPAIIYNPQGQAMQVPANLVDRYLADPKYAGWHK